jgi:glycosyltransferase involved in cell wall biosynthesis
MTAHVWCANNELIGGVCLGDQMAAQTEGVAANPLAIVIITRNEARNIGRCIESALAVAARLPATEIMLVDSASTDGTIEIARKYPINVIQLQPHWPLTASAGRYLGTLTTAGQYVLFVDGDTEVFPDWVLQALGFLYRHPEVAGAGGTLEEIYTDERGQSTGEAAHRFQCSRATEVKALGGNGLYRRAALETAGTFNPYLASMEEAELALRLRQVGYSLWRLPLPMARHFSLPRETAQETIRRIRAGYYPRCGWTLRATFKNGLAGQFIRDFLPHYIITAGYLLLGLASLVAALADQGKWLMAWSATSLAVFAVYSVRKRSPGRAFNAFMGRLMIMYGLMWGFVTGGKDAGPRPAEMIVVQHQPEGDPSHMPSLARFEPAAPREE